MSASNEQLNPNDLAPLMPKNVLNRAMDLFSVPSTGHNELLMGYYILNKLNALKISSEIDSHGNILVEKGLGNRPCFCAHLDTVHTYSSGFNIFSSGKIKDGESVDGARLYLFAEDDNQEQVGIGGDDKCGIFTCLELLRVVPNIKVVFFSSEESGGTGSSKVRMSFFEDCNFLAGIDRWNGHDFIDDYMGDKTTSKAFRSDTADLLKKYGYSSNSGLFTDCFNVQRRKLGLCSFNLSCGYYSHHSDTEYVDTNELYNCFLLCKELCDLNTQYKYQLPVPTYYNKWGKGNYNYGYSYPASKWEKGPDGKWRSYPVDDKGDAITGVWKSKSGLIDPEDLEQGLNNDRIVRKCARCGTVLFPREEYYCTPCEKNPNRYYGYDFLD